MLSYKKSWSTLPVTSVKLKLETSELLVLQFVCFRNPLLINFLAGNEMISFYKRLDWEPSFGWKQNSSVKVILFDLAFLTELRTFPHVSTEFSNQHLRKTGHVVYEL